GGAGRGVGEWRGGRGEDGFTLRCSRGERRKLHRRPALEQCSDRRASPRQGSPPVAVSSREEEHPNPAPRPARRRERSYALEELDEVGAALRIIDDDQYRRG